MDVNGDLGFLAARRTGAKLVGVFLDLSASLEEVDGLPPSLVLRHRQSSSDVTPKAIEARMDDLGIAWVQNVIFKSPVARPLENVCFSLAVAACEDGVDGGGDAPHLRDAAGWTRNPVAVQKPEVVSSENHDGAVSERGDSADRTPIAEVCFTAVVSLEFLGVVWELWFCWCGGPGLGF